jgi:hypothetical protein
MKPEWKTLALGTKKDTTGLALPLVHLKVWRENGWNFSVSDRGVYKKLKTGEALTSESVTRQMALLAAIDLLDEQRELLRPMIRADK